MKVIISYRSAPSRANSEPYCFSNVRADYDSLSFAVHMSKINAVAPAMGAHSFIISDEDTFENLAIWTLVDGEWKETVH